MEARRGAHEERPNRHNQPILGTTKNEKQKHEIRDPWKTCRPVEKMSLGGMDWHLLVQDENKWKQHVVHFAISSFKIVKIQVLDCIVKNAEDLKPVPIVANKRRRVDPDDFHFVDRNGQLGTSMVIVGDCKSIVMTCNGNWRARNERLSMRIRWAQNTLFHMFEKYKWTPRSKIADWIEHTFRENNKDADLLANEGVKSKGSEVVRILDESGETHWKYIKAYWDGAYKHNGSGGCGWLIFGSNEKNDDCKPIWQPLISWCSGIMADKCDNSAIFMEMCGFTTLVFVLKNMAAGVEIHSLPNLLDIALKDEHFQNHRSRTF